MFIEQGKTNWFFLVIVVFFAFAAGLISIIDINNSGNEIASLDKLAGNFALAQKSEKIALPIGYTLDSYSIEKQLEASCQKNSDCQTPGEYLAQSRCPFVSLCIGGKCTIVCPSNNGRN